MQFVSLQSNNCRDAGIPWVLLSPSLSNSLLQVCVWVPWWNFLSNIIESPCFFPKLRTQLSCVFSSLIMRGYEVNTHLSPHDMEFVGALASPWAVISVTQTDYDSCRWARVPVMANARACPTALSNKANKGCSPPKGTFTCRHHQTASCSLRSGNHPHRELTQSRKGHGGEAEGHIHWTGRSFQVNILERWTTRNTQEVSWLPSENCVPIW